MIRFTSVKFWCIIEVLIDYGGFVAVKDPILTALREKQKTLQQELERVRSTIRTYTGAAPDPGNGGKTKTKTRRKGKAHKQGGTILARVAARIEKEGRPMRLAELTEAIGISKGALSATLSRGKDRGVVSKAGHGQWTTPKLGVKEARE